MLQKTLKNTLLELALELQKLEVTVYKKPCPALKNSTIGQHTRHVIELFECLLTGYEAGRICYDKRKRDLLVEVSNQEAVARIGTIVNALERPDMPLQSLYEMGGREVEVETNYRRELLYNLEHCIHHQALMRVAIESFTDIQLPDNFGVAPSTISYREKICAQ